MKRKQERWGEAVKIEEQQSLGFKIEQRDILANTATASSLAKNTGDFSITNDNRAYMLGTDQPLNQLH